MTDFELKNAGLDLTPESKLAAQHRMLDGERFYWEGYEFFFDGINFVRTYISAQVTAIKPLWDTADQWQVKVDWKESLSPDNPRWCRVTKRSRQLVFTRIAGYCPNNRRAFIDKKNVCWHEAAPVSDELAAMLDAELSEENKSGK